MQMKEELALINRFTKSPLKEEDVYVFTVRLCDNEVDRDWERFDPKALEALGELFVGKSGVFDHQWSAEGQLARIYRTELCDGEGCTGAGDGGLIRGFGCRCIVNALLHITEGHTVSGNLIDLIEIVIDVRLGQLHFH